MSALLKSERNMSATHFKIEECRLSDTHFWGWVKSKSALFKKASEFIELNPSPYFFALRAKWYIIDFLLTLIWGQYFFCNAELNIVAFKYYLFFNFLKSQWTYRQILGPAQFMSQCLVRNKKFSPAIDLLGPVEVQGIYFLK